MNHRPMILVDIETTGASAKYGRITEIAALRVENMNVTDTFSTLLNPEQTVPSFITNLTGITDEMLWSAPMFKTIAEEFAEFIAGGVFVAHNVSFDYGFIKEEYKRLGVNFNMDRLCSVRLSRTLFPEHRRHNLDSVIERLGLNIQNRHRALDDAQVIYALMKQEYDARGTELFYLMNKLIQHTR
jgi:DNA polymerase III subunit epsilon